MTNAILRGKPDAGNPHVRFDEGEVASAKPRRGSLLYNERKPGAGFAAALFAAALAMGMELRAVGATPSFADEFDGPLDTNVWTRIGPGRADWNRHMSVRPDLVEMRDGCLVLVGRANTDTNADPRPYLTGGVWNRGADARTMLRYGLVEIRARFEDAAGAWPAFWMLPKDRDAQGRGWPWTGEIDIVERLNADPFVYQTAHSGWTYHKKRGSEPKQGGKATICPGAFNVYGLRRTPTALIWYVNGEETFRYEKTDGGDADQWPFTTPFYFLLDMQLGGEWVGKVDAKDLPVRMWIDWIRVYADDAPGATTPSGI